MVNPRIVSDKRCHCVAIHWCSSCVFDLCSHASTQGQLKMVAWFKRAVLLNPSIASMHALTHANAYTPARTRTRIHARGKRGHRATIHWCSSCAFDLHSYASTQGQLKMVAWYNPVVLLNPSIVSDKRGHCATIHWCSSCVCDLHSHALTQGQSKIAWYNNGRSLEPNYCKCPLEPKYRKW